MTPEKVGVLIYIALKAMIRIAFLVLLIKLVLWIF